MTCGDCAFQSITEIGGRLRSHEFSCEELAKCFLDRVRRHDPALHAFISVSEDRALAACPALSVACGFSRYGTPVGLQFAAKPGDDELLLGLGKAYELRSDWHRRIPPGIVP
jgi:Asp-tRNA(Asn)/Glu-tRNA(Gln) amidotransferase A subunit family amidase